MPTAPLPDVIANLDLSRVVQKLREQLHVENPEAVATEYRRFLTLKLEQPDALLVPGQAVDEFWHTHILDTARYHADCEAVFGRYLHHDPFKDAGDVRGGRAERAAEKATRDAYTRRFGAPPAQRSWHTGRSCG